MRLSDAILLGDSLKKCNSAQWLKRDGSCGCALGGALLASGVSGDTFYKEYISRPHTKHSQIAEFDCIKALWPWLTGEHLGEISALYCKVDLGRKTIEDVCAYVRSIEPAEEAEKLPEPTMDDGYLDEAPWSDSDTERERQNSIKGR